ncbi:hypothetical protein IVA87_19495 [Bradyrhizobium sp. 147]|uniref:hypothetical protein n=1 Tax=unclassified Bradyrhizobium TaxID=2631580 RepID=UPI001FFAA0AB|nr:MULTISPECIES: hypothetical protein [unclassified Bradyrhizobium]MCK1545368.1 hypothetical protein [Bradyrhizobium sp. 179]MCK1622172.1 hypothetical protein [Bradyrhizobium sp. 160]MCK1681537.1 hypothetical protein [Bradyrhizobium sp. 147]
MSSIFSPLSCRKFLGAIALLVSLTFLSVMSPSSAYAIDLPTDDEQDVLVRTTLMTFNDANITGNYSVLLAKGSRQFQEQMTAEKLGAAFESFRSKKLFFEGIVTDDYESQQKAKLDSEGALVLAGEFKNDEVRVKYKLRFAQNDNAWKVIGIDVDAKKHRQETLTRNTDKKPLTRSRDGKS